MIRAAGPADVARLQEIEIAAGQLFRTLGMDAIAADPPPSSGELNAFVLAGTAWVATDPEGAPAAYILVEPVGRWAHIAQVTVHPDHSRRGIGRALIDRADQWAAEHGFEGLSLTTFRDVPWNAPYYERLGFRQLPEARWPAALVDIVEREGRAGLAAWPRTVMTRAATTRQPA